MHPPIEKDGRGNRISRQQSTDPAAGSGTCQMMNVGRNPRGTITTIMPQNGNAEMALLYRAISNTAEKSVSKGIIDVEGNKCLESLTMHTVPLVRCMGKGTKGQQKMMEENQAEIEGVAIPAQVRWLSNPSIMTVREQREETKGSSVGFIVRGKMLAQRLVKKGEIATGV